MSDSQLKGRKHFDVLALRRVRTLYCITILPLLIYFCQFALKSETVQLRLIQMFTQIAKSIQVEQTPIHLNLTSSTSTLKKLGILPPLCVYICLMCATADEQLSYGIAPNHLMEDSCLES